MAEQRGEHERIAGIVGMAVGMADAMTLFTLRSFNSGGLVPWWAGVGLVVVGLAVVFLVRSLRTEPVVLIVGVGLVPLVAANAVPALLDLDDGTSRQVRAVATLVAIVALLSLALWFARKKQELDRQIVMQAAGIAFFVMVVASVVYGVATESFDAPRIAFTWLAMGGLTLWAVLLSILERRYS